MWTERQKMLAGELYNPLDLDLMAARERARDLCLTQKLRGHFAYYGITGNFRSLAWFRIEVVRCWRKWLNRRNRERSLDWNIFNRLLERYPLPPARVIHSVYYRAASP
jgi:hypothetical protein